MIAYYTQRKNNLTKWLSIEGSKPEYKNRIVLTIDQLIEIEIQQEMEYLKLNGTPKELLQLKTWKKQNNKLSWHLLNSSNIKTPVTKPKKKQRQRIKSKLIQIKL